MVWVYFWWYDLPCRPGISTEATEAMASVALVLVLLGAPSKVTHTCQLLKNFQRKCPFQNKNGLVLVSKMKFQAWPFLALWCNWSISQWLPDSRAYFSIAKKILAEPRLIMEASMVWCTTWDVERFWETGGTSMFSKDADRLTGPPDLHSLLSCGSCSSTDVCSWPPKQISILADCLESILLIQNTACWCCIVFSGKLINWKVSKLNCNLAS